MAQSRGKSKRSRPMSQCTIVENLMTTKKEVRETTPRIIKVKWLFQ
jgi:hypothetical protein